MAKYTDQQIRDKGFLYIPKQQYLQKPFQIPTTDATEDEVVTDEGIVNTNAFANAGGGGDFNPAGNMFGEGTAVSPVYGNTYIDTVRREGPDSRQAVEALINAGGTYPAGLQSAEGGFEYTSDFGNNLDYSKGAFDSLESEDQKKGFLSKMFNKVGQIKSNLPSWAQAAVTALNPFSIIPTLLGSEGGSGPKYGIAGLTDQQKDMYDALASQGMLFDSSGIMKTLTGKNFMGKGYLEGQQDIYNDLKDQGYDVDDDGNITLNGQPVDLTNKNYFKNKIKEAFTAGKGETITDPTLTPELINEFLENNNTPPTGGDGGGGDYDDNNQTDTGPVGPEFGDQDYADPGVDAEENQPSGDGPSGDGPSGDGPSGGGAGYGDAAETGAKDGFGYGLKKGGRVKYFYGGKV